jgi:hypothetical protein
LFEDVGGINVAEIDSLGVNLTLYRGSKVLGRVGGNGGKFEGLK